MKLEISHTVRKGTMHNMVIINIELYAIQVFICLTIAVPNCIDILSLAIA